MAAPGDGPAPSHRAPAADPLSAVSRVKRVRHEIKRRELTVMRVESITPHFRRITLSGESLNDFISASFDDHIKLIFSADGETPVMRDYTPRRYDTSSRELVIEFAQHGDGPAAHWAAQAQPGQSLTVAGPRGSFIIPTDYDWHLLIGDETALPAVARRLEELPAGVRALVVLNVPASDRRPLETHAHVDLRWVDGDEALRSAIGDLTLPPGEGYAWCAGEASTVAAVRRMLVEDKGHDRHAIRASAYWKRGASNHHEALE
ncbi:siderophore-interacting protein [Roseateles amylovorans]|uniref:Siderophore-interacting protein n=1 Tax=Roseateles amylovorans TaxID=2978473 RepID=A0ABY6B352_9BURK|nr:siderophore-interacting protein [Roseateles amylovorans]UXH79614.1 siderophore-interacting protein [Roseateles amylovorans]